MNIALLGYGKMGKAIEEIALQKNHKIVLKVNDENLEELTKENLQIHKALRKIFYFVLMQAFRSYAEQQVGLAN